jgi:undecaprenyl-diphosphatase
MNWLADSPIFLLILIALVAFLESFALLGVFVPGVVFLFSLSAIANATGVGPVPVMIAGALGAIVGDIGSFVIGQSLQKKASDWSWFKRHQNWLDQGEWFIRRWGWLSVIVGRFLGPLRPVIPLVAGTLGMPSKQFIPLSLLTVCFWAPAYLLPGYYTGELTELWQIQPLSNQSLVKYVISAITISASAVAIYHHAHPERWHLKGWITRHQADHWPISSMLLVILAMLSAMAIFWLTPATQDDQFLAWSVSWRQQEAASVWHSIQVISNPILVIFSFSLLLLWILLTLNYRLAMLSTAAFGITHFVGIILEAHVSRLPSEGNFVNLALLGFLITFSAMLITSRLHGLKRWPIYFATSLLLILLVVSQLWEGSLSLTASGIAVCLALTTTGLLRTKWLLLRLPQSTPEPYALLCLLLCNCIAVALISLPK